MKTIYFVLLHLKSTNQFTPFSWSAIKALEANSGKIVDIKKRFLGLVKIYTVELPSKKIEEIAKNFQSLIPGNLERWM